MERSSYVALPCRMSVRCCVRAASFKSSVSSLLVIQSKQKNKTNCSPLLSMLFAVKWVFFPLML